MRDVDLGPTDIHPDMLWLHDEALQKTLQNLQRLVDSSSDFLGYYIDWAERDIAVVYASGIDDVEAVIAEVTAIVEAAPGQAAAELAELEKLDRADFGELNDEEWEAMISAPDEPLPKPTQPTPVRVELKKACRGHGDLEKVEAEIETGAWVPPAMEDSFFGAAISMENATVDVAVLPGFEAIALKALQERFGGDVSVSTVVMVNSRIGTAPSDEPAHSIESGR